MSSLIMLVNHRSYHLYRKETDMRKVFNQLCGIVTNEPSRREMYLSLSTGIGHT